jgi:uncharacterized protein
VKLDFFEISAEGLTVTLKDVTWFPDDLVCLQFEEANIFLKRYEQRVFVEGHLSVVVQRQCDRCLDSFAMPLCNDFKVDLELTADKETLHVDAEHLCVESEMDSVILAEAVIDVHHLMQQQVYVALPLKSLCSEHCQGVCMICGENLNHMKCQCVTETESPFSVLALLNK